MYAFGRGDAGVVDQDVDRAKLRFGRVEHPVVVLDPGDVPLDGQEPPAELLDSLFDLEEALLRRPGLEDDVDPGDVETLARQGQDDAPADALSRAGDDGGGSRLPLFLGQA